MRERVNDDLLVEHGHRRDRSLRAPADPPFARLAYLQRAAGNRAVEALLDGGQAVQRDGPPGTVIEVHPVTIPPSELSYEELIEDNINIVEAMLDNYDRALDQFDKVMTSASAKEAEKKGVGAILLSEVTKMVAEKVTDLALEEFPGAKTLYESTKKLIEAVEKEEKRAAAAGYSHDLAVFVTDIRTQIGKLKTNFRESIVQIKHDAHKAQKARDPAAREASRTVARLYNQSLRSQVAGTFSEAGLYQMMAERWISGSVIEAETKAKGYVFIRLNKDWKVVVAHIHAPGGERLAEQLLREQGGTVNLNELKVRREVEFMPEELTWVNATFDESGHGGNVTENILAQKNPAYLKTFATKMTTIGIPPTTKLTGDAAPGGGEGD